MQSPTNSPTHRMRNSNIEAIRLVAMLMVVLNHNVWPNYVDPNWGKIPATCLRLLVSLLSQWGGVGDCLFFFISAWFLCNEKQSLRKNIARCWKLEKQLWFWAVLTALAAVSLWKYQNRLQTASLVKLTIHTVFPFITATWWYPTSYMLFLIVCPFLTRGLRVLTYTQHATLCIILLMLFGFLPASIAFPNDLAYSVALFLYLYVVMTFIRWHNPNFVTTHYARRLILFGLFIGMGSQVVAVAALPQSGILGALWMNCPRCIPSICIALGIIVLAINHKPRYSRLVNKMAAGTLAVYLLVTSDAVHDGLTIAAKHFPLYAGVGAIGLSVCVALLIYIFAIALDCVRQLLYSATIDRNEAKQNAHIISLCVHFRDAIVRRIQNNNT